MSHTDPRLRKVRGSLRREQWELLFDLVASEAKRLREEKLSDDPELLDTEELEQDLRWVFKKEG